MGKGYSPEQIVRKLRQAEGKLASGSTVPEVSREMGISEATFHRWRKKYGGMSSSDAKRLKELEKERLAAASAPLRGCVFDSVPWKSRWHGAHSATRRSETPSSP